EWEEIFAYYNSACDWPSCTFYKELSERYPDSKVILSLRDPKSWYKSVASTIMPAMRKPDGATAPALPGVFGPLLIGERTFNYDFSEENMIAVYERHNEEVKRTIAPERLLVFQAKDGWEPLCKFLGVPVPHKVYPSMNSTEEFQERRKAMAAGRPAS
ncbi:MAG TPA: sulfotransferase, partial [Rhizomicrobium sp.]|nr:sulfotransferase [Rhizomicrobium sp.]